MDAVCLCSHWAQFRKLFPGANNLQDFKDNEKLDAGSVEELKNSMMIWEKIGGAMLFVWEMFTKLT